VKKLLLAAALVLGCLAVPTVAGAAEAAPVGPCTPYVATSFVGAVCTVRSGEYATSITPSATLPPNQVGAAVGGGVCEGGPWCVHYDAGTDDVVVCYGYPLGPGAYMCLPEPFGARE
jgi:hypothetical protein